MIKQLTKLAKYLKKKSFSKEAGFLNQIIDKAAGEGYWVIHPEHRDNEEMAAVREEVLESDDDVRRIKEFYKRSPEQALELSGGAIPIDHNKEEIFNVEESLEDVSLGKTHGTLSDHRPDIRLTSLESSWSNDPDFYKRTGYLIYRQFWAVADSFNKALNLNLEPKDLVLGYISQDDVQRFMHILFPKDKSFSMFKKFYIPTPDTDFHVNEELVPSRIWTQADILSKYHLLEGRPIGIMNESGEWIVWTSVQKHSK